MRICHVSPHLPPDQAANALLPAHLGRWQHAAGHDVAFVTQGKAPGAGDSAERGGAHATPTDLPGPVRYTRPRSPSSLQHSTEWVQPKRCSSMYVAITAGVIHVPPSR